MANTLHDPRVADALDRIQSGLRVQVGLVSGSASR
jgi:hypothetical protein